MLWQTFSSLNKGWVFNAKGEITALFQVQLYLPPAVTARNSEFASQSFLCFA
jgi:hypothetical protein